ncbi:MAG: alpha/beta hydrolase [Phycisphaerales bacterium]
MVTLAASMAALLVAQAPGSPVPTDHIRITLPADRASLLGGGPAAGRMLLLLCSDTQVGPRARPLDAPFFRAPQPMYSVPVERLVPGQAIELGADALSFPAPVAELDGTFRVQAVFDRFTDEPGPDAPGNLASLVQTVTFGRAATDDVRLELVDALEPEPLPSAPNLRWFELRSELLSAALGRPVTMRAGVALPPRWDDPDHRRRMFPAVYVVPGFGGRHTGADTFARMLSTPGSTPVVPQAAWIVLDPEGPLGHHGFVDSAANGPRARALVEEFIPALERQFRLVRRPEARIVTGHSSGGWSALWLQLTHPETFGACFASSPDPVDFSRFQTSDLYRDASLFTAADGRDRPSYREFVMDAVERTCMTVRQEASMERVLGPDRTSGQQWDAWSSWWSAVDPATRRPRPMFDAITGEIDRTVIESQWSRHDLRRVVERDPDTYVPLLRERVRLLCGTRDGFFLERAVEGLRDAVDALVKARAATARPFPAGPGYIELVPGQTHDTMADVALMRWHGEMRAHLKTHGLD